jgi:hypothetical protein
MASSQGYNVSLPEMNSTDIILSLVDTRGLTPSKYAVSKLNTVPVRGGFNTAYFEGERPRVSTNDKIMSVEFISGSETLYPCEDAMEVYYFKDLKFNTKHKKRKRLMNEKLFQKDRRRSLRGT